MTKHLASGAEVTGVIVAAEITDKLKHAVSLVPCVTVFEYSLKFDLAEAKLAWSAV